MEELYYANDDFKSYVDKYIAKERVSLQAALTHRIVKNYAEYLAERGSGEVKLPNMWGKTAGAAHENMAEI